MVSPGYETRPKEYIDEKRGVYAISTVWGFQYINPKDNSQTNNYTEVLKEWKEKTDWSSGSRQSRQKKTRIILGEKAKDLLRSHAKKRVSTGRNDAIPHRGLRNHFFENQNFMNKLKEIEQKVTYMHIVALDSDAKFENITPLQEIKDFAESSLHEKGLHIQATDYIYERLNIYDWYAGVLDKVGRYKLERHQKFPFDAYPAEPGLTISYASAKGQEIRENFLKDKPFGPEYAGDARDGGFKDLVNSQQSVEGKNLRQKWRNYINDPVARINRTKSSIIVTESEVQRKGHKNTLGQMAKSVKENKGITVQQLKTLISSDNYHSLTPDRNNNEQKEDVQMEIIQKAEKIFNDVLLRNMETDEKEKKEKKEKESIIKQQLLTELQQYMDQ
jgi:hypothetical protein